MFSSNAVHFPYILIELTSFFLCEPITLYLVSSSRIQLINTFVALKPTHITGLSTNVLQDHRRKMRKSRSEVKSRVCRTSFLCGEFFLRSITERRETINRILILSVRVGVRYKSLMLEIFYGSENMARSERRSISSKICRMAHKLIRRTSDYVLSIEWRKKGLFSSLSIWWGFYKLRSSFRRRLSPFSISASNNVFENYGRFWILRYLICHVPKGIFSMLLTC